jgi:mannose/fructose/N-acetylgalactosamine-specific phosphotransferase system component IID
MIKYFITSMTEKIANIMSSFGPIFVGNIIAFVVFLITLSYTVGNLEAKIESRWTQLEQSEISNHSSVVAEIASDKVQINIKLKAVEDRLDKAEKLQEALNKVASELSALRAEQTQTTLRISELRDDIRSKK